MEALLHSQSICTLDLPGKPHNPPSVPLHETNVTLGGSSDQLALEGIHYRFQPVVGTQFLVDVMEVVPECAGVPV